MHIDLTPQRRDERLCLSVTGDVVTINGAAFDFSLLPDGATLPRAAVGCDWLASDIGRIDGVLHLTLNLPHGANAPEETRFPAPIIIRADGPVTLPAYEQISD